MNLTEFDKIVINTSAGKDSQAMMDYDLFIVAFSGGKDSTACFLRLLDLGVPKDRIELWHHDIDGRPASKFRMDWPCTPAYVDAFAHAFDVPIYHSWREGGFEREINRQQMSTGAIWFETPDGLRTTGGKGPMGTRMKFPQVSADLRVRWCSAYLKIDVARSALCGQERFSGKKICFITGERAEESAGRAKYAALEPHHSDTRNGAKKRHIDHWRSIHQWTESEVWKIIRAHRVKPHPAYRLGWGRVSCMTCIFGSANQWASARHLAPQFFAAVAERESQSGLTIQRGASVVELADRGQVYAAWDPGVAQEALAETWESPIILQDWILPAGAFGEKTGPT